MNHKVSPQGMFAGALQHHQAGHLNDAERLYRKILQIDPHHADALHMLGFLAHQVGRHDAALDLIGKAIARNDRNPAFHYNLGTVLQAHGDLDAAVASYERALALNPDLVEAHYNLGNVQRAQGRLDEAVASYGRALAGKPGYAKAHCNLGIALQQQGDLDAAVASFGRALAHKQDYAEAHCNLGNVLHEQDKLDEAVASFERALTHKPDLAEAYCNLGNVLKEQGKSDMAITAYAQALYHKPDYAEAHYNLGVALREQGDLADAEDKLRAAVASYRRALAHKPDLADAHYNLGIALREQGKVDEAMASYAQALVHKPDYAEAHYNLGVLHLLTGRYETGWPGYDWRWRVRSLMKQPRDFGVPRWNGEDLAGRTILLHAEQGMGDTLQFCRYVPMVAERGGRIVLEVQRPLLHLLSGVAENIQLFARGDPLPTFDLQCPLLSLPHVFATRLETIPPPPLLTVKAERIAAWRERLPSSGVRIGIAWQGNPTQKNDHNRSMPPAYLLPLASLCDDTERHFVSVQKDGPAAPRDFPLIDFMGEVDDFADTAALIGNIDLVITVDTAVAHLAAALGRPVWLLNCFDPCWRWLQNRRDSPWYPGLRIFRQPAPGDWDGVIGEVAQALRSQAIFT